MRKHTCIYGRGCVGADLSTPQMPGMFNAFSDRTKVITSTPTMTKAELIDAIKDYPDDAEVMTTLAMYARCDIMEIFYDKERDTIVIV